RAREQRKIHRNLQGIREMNRLPGALIVVDVHRERNAVREAKKLGIPTICLIDTDSDPDFADVPIPGNDDAIRSIDTVLSHLVDAVEEGLKARTAPEPEESPSEGQQGRPRRGEGPTEVVRGAGRRSAPSDAPPTTHSDGGESASGRTNEPDGAMLPAAASDPEAS
ncbi:MAG: 30S ribosomal protein S2, partial [Phycisphaerae bacterium]